MGTTYKNRSLLRDLGHPPGSEQAERSLAAFAEYMPPSERPHLAQLPVEWAALADGCFRDDEYHLNHADGNVRSFASREVVYARRPDGTVRQILGTLTEITQRKRAEQALERSEQRFRELADAIPQIVWIAGPDGGLIDLNAKATEYTGVGTEGLKGWSWDQVIHPDDLAATVADWKDCLEQGLPRDMSFRIRRADGAYRWHITRQVPVRDATGTVTSWYGTCTDVEDLKRAETSRLDSETRFRLLFEGAADAIFWADAETGLLTHCNGAAEQLLGCDRSELIGQPQSCLHPPEEAEHYRQLFQEHASRRSTSPMEVQVLRKDGRRIDVAISPSVTTIGGQRVIQGIFRDVTEQKRAAATIQKLSKFRETIIRTAAEGICVCFPVAAFPFVAFSVWNDRMTEITGYTIEEINQHGWYQSLYPDPEVQQRAMERMARMRFGDDLRAEEWEIVRKNGERRIISLTTSLIDYDDDRSGVAALIQDITHQKQAVQSLQESQRSLQLFRELVSWTNDTIHVIDPATSRFLDANERACERLGYSRAELLQLGVLDIETSLPDDFSWQRHAQDLKAAGSLLLEGVHRRKDGSTFPVEINVRLVTVEGQDYMVAVARDITERRQAEAVQQLAMNDLRRSEERFSKLFHASPFSIIVASYPAGKIIEANNAFLRIFEFDRDEVIGRTTGDLEIWVLPEDRQRMLESVRTVGAARNMEYLFRTKSGKLRTLVMSVEIIRINQQDYSLAMSIDITERKAAEAELQKTHALLQAVVHNTADAVFVKDREGKYLLFNEAAGRFVGVPAADVIGRDDSTLFDPAAVAVIRAHDDMVMETGLVSTSEETLTAAGVSRTYLATKAPYRDEAGRIIGLVGISHDISARKMAEQRLRENEQQLRLLMDSVPAYIAYIDAEERYRWVNHAYVEWYQRPRDEIIGRTVQELQEAENYAAVQPQMLQALQGEAVHYEQTLESRNQERRTFDTHYVPHRSDEGSVLGFFVLVFDITRERAIQHELRESEERYRKLFETCADAIFILDLEGRIQAANPAAAAMHGFAPEQLVGRSIRELDVPVDADRVPARMQRLLAGETLRFEVMHRRGDGTLFPVDVVATLLPIGDEPLVLSFDRDITERKRAENALAASELRYRTLIEATHAVTWACPANGLQIEPQPAWMEFTGQSAEEVLGWGWTNAIHPEDRAAVHARWNQAIEAGEPFLSDHRIRRRDGEWRWVNVHAVPFRDARGEILEWLGINFDLTPQKRMEETLRHILEVIAPTSGQDYFAALVKHLARVCGMDYGLVGVFEDGCTNLRSIAISHRGESIPNLVYPLVNTPCETLRDQDLCTYPVGVSQHFPTNHLLAEMGIESYLGVPLKSLSGRVLGVLALFHTEELPEPQLAETLLRVVARQAAAELERAITENARQTTLLSLQESELFLRMTQEAAHIGSWEWDPQTGHCQWSEELARISGVGSEAGAGSLETALSFRDDESQQRFQAFLSELAAGRETEGVECGLRQPDGTTRDVWFVGQIRRVEDARSAKVLGVAIDITERKRAEEHRHLLVAQLSQAQKLEAIGRLAGGVAHDFNNILTVINGYTRLLQKLTPTGDERAEMLSEISEAGARAAALTQQLLNYSRKQVVKRSDLDLNELVRGMENMLRQLIGETIRLQIAYHHQPAAVHADASQIGQVVMNLVVNARDAMPRGGTLTIETAVVELEPGVVEAHRGRQPGKYVQLTVSDTGCGIPESLLDQIFEPFFTTKSAGTGTGLGLASVRSIAEDSGGFVSVESRLDEGSCFRFYLPATSAVTLTNVGPLARSTRGRETILLVEDEYSVRGVMRRFLEQAGYHVLDAAGGAEALVIAERHANAIDLLITDVVMPEMTGRELVERLTTRWPRLKYLYVSGYSPDEVVRHGVLQAQVTLLQKPFSPEALAMKVRELLDQPRSSG